MTPLSDRPSFLGADVRLMHRLAALLIPLLPDPSGLLMVSGKWVSPVLVSMTHSLAMMDVS
jgi:hypothetical protein